MDYNNINHKDKLSLLVIKILRQKGFSFLYNEQDFRRYKKQCKGAFNEAHTIAQRFLERAEEKSDFSTYIF